MVKQLLRISYIEYYKFVAPSANHARIRLPHRRRASEGGGGGYGWWGDGMNIGMAGRGKETTYKKSQCRIITRVNN